MCVPLQNVVRHVGHGGSGDGAKNDPYAAHQLFFYVLNKHASGPENSAGSFLALFAFPDPGPPAGTVPAAYTFALSRQGDAVEHVYTRDS